MARVLLSVGDASADVHAAAFVRALRRRRPDCRFVGLGGPEMAAEGVELVVDQRELAVGGIFELLGGARRLQRAWRGALGALRERAPDLVVLMDSGGFNLPLARRARRLTKAPILYYVAPQVWAWRPGRIRKLAERVDRLAVIFPFEPDVYRDADVRVDFVGHPSVESLRETARALSRESARQVLGLDPAAPLIALLPGSRRNEVARQLPIQLEAARILHGRDPRVRFAVVPAPSISTEQIDRLIAAAGLPADLALAVLPGAAHEAIRAADVALAKPGTVTLEIALLERPMVVMGRAHPLTAAVLRRTIQVPWLAMPNLIAGEEIVPELLQARARPAAIADALAGLLDGPARRRQLERLAEVAKALGDGGAAEAVGRIAEEMLEHAAA